jgi:hypothetical protein
MRPDQSAFSIRPAPHAFQGDPGRPEKRFRVGKKGFTKYPFQIDVNLATILRKEHQPQWIRKRSSGAMATICKHPRVRVVSRHEDTEFVECLECGEIFDSEEFRDMEIEETAEKEDIPGDY